MESGLQNLLRVSEEPQVLAVALPPLATKWLKGFYILLQYMRRAEQQISDFLTPQ